MGGGHLVEFVFFAATAMDSTTWRDLARGPSLKITLFSHIQSRCPSQKKSVALSIATMGRLEAAPPAPDPGRFLRPRACLYFRGW